MTVKEFFSIKTNKFFWVNIAAMVAIVIVLLFVTLKAIDLYTRHGEGVVVPDVKGMSVEEATMMFRNHGLTCVVSDSTYVKNKPAGIVLELTPAAGQKVKEGRMIYLTLNALKVPLRQVPDVADNSSFREAEARILAAGFKLGAPQIVSGEQDWVYGLKYHGRELSAGDKVPAGATLVLMVGDGTGEHVESDSLETDSVVGTEPVSAEAPTEESWF